MSKFLIILETTTIGIQRKFLRRKVSVGLILDLTVKVTKNKLIVLF